MPNEGYLEPSVGQPWPATEVAWQAARAAEITTAESFHDVAALRCLINLYGDLGYEDQALHLLTRSLRFQFDRPQVLTLMLDLLVRRRALHKLTPIVSLASKIPDRSAPLRRALATAYFELGQVPQAAAEWRALLQEPPVDPATWRPLASFLNRHGDVNGIAQLLEELRPSLQKAQLDPHAQFCLLRLQMDRSVPEARQHLNRIPPKCLDDPELQLSLTIMAFRLGAYGRARREVRRAQALKPGWNVAANVLRTVDSFAAKAVQGMPLISLPPQILEAAKAHASRTPSDQYAWGLIHVTASNRIEARLEPLGSLEDRLLEVPADTAVPATFSVLPDSPQFLKRSGRACDPLQILPFVDWSVPHLMIQRHGANPVVHAFVEAPDHREWYWEEVSVRPHSPEGHPSSPGSVRQENWRKALQEIHARTSKEEL